MAQFPLPQTLAYDDPDGPFWMGRYAGPPPSARGLITVVNYNVNHGQNVMGAIEVVKALEPLPSADIVLLQEMDETGTEQMAEALRCNFVYYPATVSRYNRNFGNAILSRWPLTDARKLILPGRHPVNKVMRIAVSATVHLDNLVATIYSVHTETYTVPVSYRRAQIEAVVEDIGSGDSPTIVGGDFNTVSKRSIDRMTEQFAAIGLSRKSAGAGPTVSKLGVKATAADHIFARGFCRVGRGKLEEARASDHFPIWVQLIPDPGDCSPSTIERVLSFTATART